MKKTLSLFCLGILLFSLLTACGGASSEKEKQTPFGKEEAEEEYLYDFVGEKLKLYQATDITQPLSYKESTTLADAAMERLKKVEKELNCTIELFSTYDPAAYYAMMEYIKKQDATASYYADVVFSQECTNMRLAAQGKAFLPIDDVSDILNFHDHEKWGSVAVLETMMCQGTLYGLSPQYWINLTAIPFYTLVYNRDLVTKEYGMADPHELYENKTWTRPALENYVLTCTTVEEGQTKIYGIAANRSHIVRQAILSNGCQMVETDDQGNPVCGWTNDAAIEALTWAQSFILEHKDAVCSSYGASSWDTLIPFDEGIASFLLTQYSYVFNKVAYEVQDFGFMPWPSGPTTDYGQWVGYYETASAVAIPIEAIDTEGSAYVIDRIFEPMEEYPTFDAIRNYYLTNVLHDELDAEILFVNRDNPLTQYCYWPDGGDDFLGKIQDVALDAKASVPATLERNKFLLEKVIEKEIYPNRANLDRYR